VTCKEGEWTIIDDLENSAFITEKMEASEAELLEEAKTCSDLF
jgi:hypothetical protein